MYRIRSPPAVEVYKNAVKDLEIEHSRDRFGRPNSRSKLEPISNSVGDGKTTQGEEHSPSASCDPHPPDRPPRHSRRSSKLMETPHTAREESGVLYSVGQTRDKSYSDFDIPHNKVSPHNSPLLAWDVEQREDSPFSFLDTKSPQSDVGVQEEKVNLELRRVHSSEQRSGFSRKNRYRKGRSISNTLTPSPPPIVVSPDLISDYKGFIEQSESSVLCEHLQSNMYKGTETKDGKDKNAIPNLSQASAPNSGSTIHSNSKFSFIAHPESKPARLSSRFRNKNMKKAFQQENSETHGEILAKPVKINPFSRQASQLNVQKRSRKPIEAPIERNDENSPFEFDLWKKKNVKGKTSKGILRKASDRTESDENDVKENEIAAEAKSTDVQPNVYPDIPDFQVDEVISKFFFL